MWFQAGRPVLCLVTDRARLGRPAGTAALVDLVGAAARAGVDLIQIRERDLAARDLRRLVAECLDAVRETGARLVVNDRLDVALGCGAHGVHLRADSFEAWRARTVAPPDFLVGRSVHGEAEAVAAAERGDLDYLILGTLHETASKPAGHPQLGLEACARIARRVTIPILAIGGITLDRLPGVLGTGVAGIAAVGLFAEAGDGETGAAARRAREAADAVVAGRRSGKLTPDSA